MAETASDSWVSLSDSDPDNVGYFAEHHDSTHCRHGTFVGYPGGADYMCGLCEDGMDTWVDDPEFEMVMYRGDESPVYTHVRWRLSDLTNPARRAIRRFAHAKRFMRLVTGDPRWSVGVERVGAGYWK